MSENSQEEWTEEAVMPPKKKGIPSWLFFCGGGCLIAMVLGAVGVFLLYGMAQSAINPETQWASLEEKIEMDARPNEMSMMMGINAMGTEMWTMRDSRGYMVMIFGYDESDAGERDKIFNGEIAGSGVPGVSEITDTETAEVSIQGRMLPIVRLNTASGGRKTPGCFLDITPEGAAGYVVMHVTSDGTGSQSGPLSEEALNDLLKAFVIGSDREVYVPDGPHPQAGQTSVDFEQTFAPQIEVETPAVEATETVEEVLEEVK